MSPPPSCYACHAHHSLYCTHSASMHQRHPPVPPCGHHHCHHLVRCPTMPRASQQVGTPAQHLPASCCTSLGVPHSRRAVSHALIRSDCTFSTTIIVRWPQQDLPLSAHGAGAPRGCCVACMHTCFRGHLCCWWCQMNTCSAQWPVRACMPEASWASLLGLHMDVQHVCRSQVLWPPKY
jgi:hypothetical protein